MSITLHNSTTFFEPTFQRINQRSINGKTIYLKSSYDGTLTYTTKSREMVITPSKEYTKVNVKVSHLSFNTVYKPLEPFENEQLYREYPERFSAYRMVLLREQIINNGQSWNERKTVTI